MDNTKVYSPYAGDMRSEKIFSEKENPRSAYNGIRDNL